MITIHGRATSSNVQPVMWAVAELGLAHRRLDVGGAFGGTDTPEFLAMNPNGLVPVLVDGDLTLFESCAILRYLGARYGGEAFWPSDPAARGRLDQWAEWIKTSVLPALVYKVFWQLVRTPERERSQAAIKEGAATLARLMPMIETRLGENPWLGGREMCFADIMLGHFLYRYFTLEFERVELPRIAAYYERLCGRPAYAEHVMVSYESLRAR